MVTIGQISITLGLWSWWVPSLYARGHIPLGAWVQPSATNDHHLWSFHKCYLWRLPPNMHQIDLMAVILYIYIYVYIWLSYLRLKYHLYSTFEITVLYAISCYKWPRSCGTLLHFAYRQVSNLTRTKSQHKKDFRTVLRLSLPNPLKPDAKSRMKMQLEQRRQAMLQLHLNDWQFYCLLRCTLY